MPILTIFCLGWIKLGRGVLGPVRQGSEQTVLLLLLLLLSCFDRSLQLTNVVVVVVVVVVSIDLYN